LYAGLRGIKHGRSRERLGLAGAAQYAQPVFGCGMRAENGVRRRPAAAS
jgi:hypothetical protein